jgi:hypothetical protein
VLFKNTRRNEEIVLNIQVSAGGLILIEIYSVVSTARKFLMIILDLMEIEK